jgi:cytochrome P450
LKLPNGPHDRSYAFPFPLLRSLRFIFRPLEMLDEYHQKYGDCFSFIPPKGSPLSSTLIFFRSLQKDWGAWSPWGRFLRTREEIDRLLFAEIRERRQEADSDRDDILSMLLSAKDENGRSMTDAELKDQLLTLLFAGHETTASALGWSLYWIDRLPEVRQKLAKEIETVSINEEPIAATKLPYLTAICQETLRIYPIAFNAFPRIAQKTVEIMGYEFERGTALIPSIYLTHQQENLYPQPKLFQPERFLEKQFSPYEYIPFGGSNRLCIGYAFAQFEMKIVLATIFSQCNLTLTNKRPVKPSRRGLTLAPPGNMRMKKI